MEHMSINILKYLRNPTKVLDIGSINIKRGNGKLMGCYKPLIPKGFTYIGVDLTSGENVDVVLENPYLFPFEDNSFGAVITGQCFEHVKNPFKLMKECARILEPGGYFLGVAPYMWNVHRVPVDCWRILSDGWVSLFEESGLITVETYLIKISEGYGDSWGIAKK